MPRPPRLAILALLLPLAACGSEPQRREQPPAPAVADSDDPAVALAADPEGLKALRRRCRADREAVGGELCEAAARATRMRFMNDGPTAYAPGVVSGETGGADANNGQTHE